MRPSCSLRIEPRRPVRDGLLGSQHGLARLGQLLLELEHARLVIAGVGLGGGLLQCRLQLGDLLLHGGPAGVVRRAAACLQRRYLLLELGRTPLELLRVLRLLLERGHPRLHVVRVDLARRLGAQVGQHALQLGAALVGAGGAVAQLLDRGLALVDLRLERLQLRLQVGRDAVVVRVAIAAGVAEHVLELGGAGALALHHLEQVGDALLVLRQLRLELADARDRLRVDRRQVDPRLMGCEGPLTRDELSLALRQQLLGLLQELLRLLLDPDLDLLFGGSRLAIADRAAQAARRTVHLGQLLQAGMDVALAHVPPSIGRGGG